MRYGSLLRGHKGAALVYSLVVLAIAVVVGGSAVYAAAIPGHVNGGRTGRPGAFGPRAPAPTPTPVPPTPPTCAGPWYQDASASPGTWINTLNGIAGISSTDIWAVGYSDDSGGPPQLTLTEHWNGTNWSQVSSPSGSQQLSTLNAVAAIASNDVWAVGADGSQMLTEHWNGSAWSIVSIAAPLSGANPALDSIAAVSSNDVWAAGYYWYYAPGSPYGLLTPLVEHWDGNAWSAVATPDLGPYQAGSFSAVAAVATNDVWAVGWYSTELTLTEHWDGTTWSIVSSPNPSANQDYLHGAVAISSNDVWAVGNADTSPYRQSLLEHWNGTQWSAVPGPSVSGGDFQLLAVGASSSSDVWAVGYGIDVNSANTWTSLIEHWNGTTWSIVSDHGSILPGSQLNSVFAVSPLRVWAVGSIGSSTGPNSALAMRYQQYSPPSLICTQK